MSDDFVSAETINEAIGTFVDKAYRATLTEFTGEACSALVGQRFAHEMQSKLSSQFPNVKFRVGFTRFNEETTLPVVEVDFVLGGGDG